MAAGADYQKASVTPLRTLALQVADDAMTALDAIAVHADGRFVVFDPQKPTRYTFTLEDVPYATTLTPEDEGDYSFRISARLGRIPFTVQSAERRVAVMRLLRLCKELPETRFVPGVQQALWIMSRPRTISDPTPDSVLHETLSFIQQIRPYVRVVRPYLEAPQIAA